MQVKSIAAAIAIMCCCAQSTLASILVFEDKSAYENFKVFEVRSSGKLVELKSIEGYYGFALDLSDRTVGETIKFSVRFDKPDEQGSVEFDVRAVETMQVSLEIAVTRELKEGFIVPVYYFKCIGMCGFSEIDVIPDGIPDKQFERFFKGALMAEHYRLKLKNRENPYVKRALKLWRDGSYALGAHFLDWWKVGGDISLASQQTFGVDSIPHQATEKYRKEVNSKFSD